MKGKRYDSKQGIEGIMMMSNNPLVKSNIRAERARQSKTEQQEKEL